MQTKIAQETRRGKGNMILCSADVASALTMAESLDYTPALNANLNVDDTGNTFAGVLAGKYRVYIDPYSSNASVDQYYVAGYKGTSPYDAGLFYCPYVPLQMVRAVGENTFQPRSDLRLVTVWLQTHLQMPASGTVPILVQSRSTQTGTTEESPSKTSCDPQFTYFFKRVFGPSFYLNKNKNNDSV